MKNLAIVVCAAALSLPLFGHAQNALLNKFKNKVKDRMNQRIDQGMDKAIDKTEESAREAATGTGDEEATAKASTSSTKGSKSSSESKGAKAVEGGVKSYSRYDFVPGNMIVYAEDFAQDVIGEFPMKWMTNSRGEVVKVEGSENKWLRLFPGSKFLSPAIKTPDNYTVEFDILIGGKEEDLGYVLPDLVARLVQLPATVKGNEYFQYSDSYSDINFTFGPAGTDDLRIGFESSEKGHTYMSSPVKSLKTGRYWDKPHHVALWVQKERMRMWVDGDKVYDMPNAIPVGLAPSRMVFEVPTTLYTEDQLGIYVTDFKVAEGAADLRTKLINEGKFVTTGILFDVNSDRIKPQSAGVLQEMAQVLKENQAVKVKIVGYTDSDGDDKLNLELSKKRAAAVSHALATDYGIDASRFQTDGLGETKPVADNNTKEGKAQNRRVEFTKL